MQEKSSGNVCSCILLAKLRWFFTVFQMTKSNQIHLPANEIQQTHNGGSGSKGSTSPWSSRVAMPQFVQCLWDLTQNCSERVVNLVDSVEYVEKIGGHWWHRVAKASGWLRLSSTAHKPGSGQHAGFKWPQAKDAKDAEGSHFLPSLQQAVHPANARWCEQAVGYHTICSWEIILWKWQCHH